MNDRLAERFACKDDGDHVYGLELRGMVLGTGRSRVPITVSIQCIRCGRRDEYARMDLIEARVLGAGESVEEHPLDWEAI